MHQQTFAHLPLDEVAVFWTIDFLVFQEDTVTMTSAHEVVVTGAWCETAADCCPGQLTLLAVLKEKQQQVVNVALVNSKWKKKDFDGDGQRVSPAVSPWGQPCERSSMTPRHPQTPQTTTGHSLYGSTHSARCTAACPPPESRTHWTWVAGKYPSM